MVQADDRKRLRPVRPPALHVQRRRARNDYPRKRARVVTEGGRSLNRAGRAILLESSEALEAAHQAAAWKGDTAAPEDGGRDQLSMHFVAFVKGKDGHLWELKGNRKGPLDRGLLEEEDDALSEKALDMGFRRYIKMEKDAGGKDLRFSCIALASKLS
jgi:ubiquitin carboxyl-terminal hydrolase L3